ncbi:hypothetical protein JMA_05900 [Jeotgalibacillus malaysiensis]|uniref:Uncharacterized protein n=1 Tax=Jeotgalibacillus malaysiensis TaxID=1508404 RepID=A0A0B5AMM5_9BACL|nr:hypothetical protein [Jeotgalibacillus malaysiensis]AJD89907.1 hypothetical protein JMA_05900 [Jeotgalibacillus malaysiensis]
MKRVLIETVCSVIFYILLAVAVSSTIHAMKEIDEGYEAMAVDEVLGKSVEVSSEMNIGSAGMNFEAVQEVTDVETGQTETDAVNVTMSPIPWLLLFIFTIPWMIYSYKTRDRSKSFNAFAMNMTEFQESDEREIQITRSATKAAYKSVGIAIPLLIATMVIQPSLWDALPGYPVYLLAAAIIIPTLVYGIVWIKEYKK